ncbi:uncharacterized protein LOC133824310 [Humulus lupulus]|uniref:uncharacterized protein LOC133824310 n=1 Tax=Humulus lupulus TaxID=3486 RepID=UPI002B4052A4|nr:uncharacterized protein LOC133824310 [Humulus lupulus]
MWNGIAVQYGTNDYRDLSRLSPTYREGPPPASSEDGGISWSPSSISGESSSNMDSDLDALIDNAGAKRSKRPRARGLTTSQPGKSSKRSRKTPPPPPPASSSAAASTGQTNVPTTIPPSQVVVPVVAPASQTDIAAVVESQPPVAGQMPSTQLAKRPSASRAQKLTISTHMDSYVVDNAAGPHGSTLISDVMSRIGQSYGNFEAPQWQCLTGTRDRTVLYEKSIEHTASALAFTAQLNYELNNEVHTSRTLVQEERDLHLKANDDLKAVNTKLEAVVKEREEMAKELRKLKNELEEQKKDNIQLRETNKKLEEDKIVTLDLMEDIKTRLTAEFKEKKETAVDSAMYRMWAYNEELDTSFLGPLEASFLERWNARLEKEEADQLEKDKATPSTVSEGAQEDSHAIRPEGSGATDAEKAKETPLL